MHGLGGDPFGTWRAPNETKSWLDWLSADASAVGVWTFGYESAATAWFGQSMSLYDRATTLVDLLESSGLTKPIIFVAHSMGGLVVKRALEHAVTYNLALAQQVKAILFLSTPHAGSHLADYLVKLAHVTQASTPARELTTHNPELSRVNAWYQQQATRLNIESRVYYETLKTRGVTVVDAQSASPGLVGVMPTAVQADHNSIAAPSSQQSQLYMRLVKIVQDIILRSEMSILRPNQSPTLVEQYDKIALLEVTEKLKADIAIGKTDSVMSLRKVIEALERERQAN